MGLFNTFIRFLSVFLFVAVYNMVLFAVCLFDLLVVECFCWVSVSFDFASDCFASFASSFVFALGFFCFCLFVLLVSLVCTCVLVLFSGKIKKCQTGLYS